jgi:hypothetical protein
MFTCSCGGVLLVKEVEQYPDNLSTKEKLEYQRTCIVECSVCSKVVVNQKYD